MPIVQLLSASPLLPAILPAIAVPGLLLLFPLDCACTDVARGGGGRLIRGRFVGEGELVREGRASAPRRRGRCRQGGVWVLAIKAGSRSCHQGRFSVAPSRRVLGRAIKAGSRFAIKADSRSCHQ